MLCASQPRRIFNVTGSGVAWTTASMSRSADRDRASRPNRKPAGHAFGRAAHIDVDDIGAGIGRELRAQGQPFSGAAGELDDQGFSRPAPAARRTVEARACANWSDAVISDTL